MMTKLPTSLSLAVVSLLLNSPRVNSLSSHSPQDLFAYPKYQIILDEQPLLDSLLPDYLTPSSSSAASSTPSSRAEDPESEPTEEGETHHLLRTPAGHTFLCTVPASAPPPPPPSPSTTAASLATLQQIRSRGLERGLDLLEPMRGSCLWLKQGWFTYSFCYGDTIRQFHEIRVAGSPSPSEDPNADAYTLGNSPPPIPIPLTAQEKPKYGSGSGSSLTTAKTSRIPASLGGGGVGGFGVGGGGIGSWDDGGSYLSQRWEGGTVCDKTGLQRSVEVQFHCNTQSSDRIFLIRETSICNYVLLIHTPRLCAEPIFLERRAGASADGDGLDSAGEKVRCRPVVGRLGLDSSETSSDDKPSSDAGKSQEDWEKEEEKETEEEVKPKIEVLTDDSPLMEESDTEIEMMVVFDPETGKVHEVQDAEGHVLFELLDEALNGLGGEEIAGEGGAGDDIRRVDGLKDLAKLMQKSIKDALGRSSSDTPSSAEDEEEPSTHLAISSLEALLQSLTNTPSSTPAAVEDETPTEQETLQDYLGLLQEKLLAYQKNLKEEEGKESELSKVLGSMFGKDSKAATAVEKEGGEDSRKRDEL